MPSLTPTTTTTKIALILATTNHTSRHLLQASFLYHDASRILVQQLCYQLHYHLPSLDWGQATSSHLFESSFPPLSIRFNGFLFITLFSNFLCVLAHFLFLRLPSLFSLSHLITLSYVLLLVCLPASVSVCPCPLVQASRPTHKSIISHRYFVSEARIYYTSNEHFYTTVWLLLLLLASSTFWFGINNFYLHIFDHTPAHYWFSYSDFLSYCFTHISF